MDIQSMTNVELENYVINTYDVCVELMRRTGYYSKWKAIDNGFNDYEGAIKVAKAIAEGCSLYAEKCLEDLWDEAAIDAAGIDEEEYYENPDAPLWKRDDWKWNEEDEEWELIEE